MNMKTSIIVLAYKHERYVREALQSAVMQTHKADEIIIVDDASPDSTAQVIRAFIADNISSPLRLICNEENIGVTGSFALAVAASSGDVIFCFAGDDVSEPCRIEECLGYLSSRPSAYAVITNACIIDDASRIDGHLDNCAGLSKPIALNLADIALGDHFLRGRSSCGAAAAYRAAVFREFPPLKTGLYAEDDPLAFRAMLLGSCDFLPLSLVRWRKHTNNLSHGTGTRRGPEMALHYRKCEAMIDQMLADADEWALRNSQRIDNGFRNALADLRFRKAIWALWSATHEKGLRLAQVGSACWQLFAHAPSPFKFIIHAWRPLIRMITPFAIQRFAADIRSGS